MKVFLTACLLSLASLSVDTARADSPPENRWSLASDGGIVWKVKPDDTHGDNVEMDGFKVAVVTSYEVNRGTATISNKIVWPNLRFQPNETFDHFVLTFGEESQPKVLIDGQPLNWNTTEVWQKGIL